jgi:radical SAM protein with 4Fe4S-binding SPASM domain
MLVRHAKHVGYRRYGDNLALVGYSSGEFMVLGEAAVALWESLEATTPLDAILARLNPALPPAAVLAILQDQLDKGLLVAAPDAATLANRHDAPPATRGVNTDKLFGAFLGAMRGLIDDRQLLKTDLEINNACNLRCTHCYITDYRDRDLLTLDEIETLFDDLVRAGVLFLNLTGAEMTLRRDFLDILEAARRRHFVVTILTNATRLREDQIEALARIGLASIFVSLYGVTADTHEQITDRHGTFDATMATVRRLRNHNLPVVLRFLAMRHNTGDIPHVARFAEEMDALFTTSYSLFTTDGAKAQTEAHRIPTERLAELFEKGWLAPPKPAQCIAGAHKLRISSAGDVYPCELLRLRFGNLRRATVQEIMAAPSTAAALSEIHAPTPDCRHTAEHRSCSRCPGLAYHEDGSVRSSSSEACRHTDAHLLAISGAPGRSRAGV